MPSYATQILNAVAGALGQTYPLPPIGNGPPIKTRRASDKNPLWVPGDPTPLIVVTGNDGEEVEEGTGIKVFVQYRITVNYLSKELPGDRREDTTMRDAIDTIRSTLHVIAIPTSSLELQQAANDVKVRVLKPYVLPLKDVTVNCAAIMFTYETFELRNRPVNGGVTR